MFTHIIGQHGADGGSRAASLANQQPAPKMAATCSHVALFFERKSIRADEYQQMILTVVKHGHLTIDKTRPTDGCRKNLEIW